MKEIKLKICAESPLAIGRKKPGGSVSEAQDYIPGSVIRGTVADLLISLGGEPTTGDDFDKIFLSGEAAIFRNAYLSTSILPATAVSSKTDSGFKPATAVSSKTDSGFKLKKNGVFDTLIDRFCAEAHDYPYDPNCPEDGGRVEPYSSYYQKDDQTYKSCSSVKRLLTRAGINRRRATTEEEILYSIEVLNEKVIYHSSILLEDENLANSLGAFLAKRTLYLGGATSRGLGKVSLVTAEVISPELAIGQAIKQFNDKLRERWQLWSIFGEPQEALSKDKTYFTINLQSDAILKEDWLHTTVISEAMLQEFAEFKDDSLKLHTAYSAYDYLSGWNTAWGLMKDMELITNKGGVYLFSTNQSSEWLPKLEKLCLNGVGDRRAEGFGQIKICDDFHLVFREIAV